MSRRVWKWFCAACGHKFRSGLSWERACLGKGCPKCGRKDEMRGTWTLKP